MGKLSQNTGAGPQQLVSAATYLFEPFPHW
jgi:hypothetical protein